MQITNKAITEIQPYEKNPRRNDNAVGVVAKSIKEFGFKVPIVIDNEGVIVAGHTRYRAAVELGLQEVPCIIADDLNEEQIKAFRLVDNKTSEYASWDYELLNIELEDITNIDMGEFGLETIDTSYIDDLLSEDYVELYGEKDSFEISFTIPIEHKEMIMEYISENTKDPVVRMIISEAEEWSKTQEN